MNWKSLFRVALGVLIGSVSVSAVLDVLVLFSRELDDFDVRTLGTTLFMAAAALLVMMNSAFIEEKPRRHYLFSVIGVVTVLVALPIFLTALWVDAEKFWWDGMAGALWNTGASLEIASLVAALFTLRSLRRLPTKYRSMAPIATTLALAFGLIAVIMIWTGVGGDSVSDALLSVSELRWLWQ
jgi:hypothetical protein